MKYIEPGSLETINACFPKEECFHLRNLPMQVMTRDGVFPIKDFTVALDCSGIILILDYQKEN